MIAFYIIIIILLVVKIIVDYQKNNQIIEKIGSIKIERSYRGLLKENEEDSKIELEDNTKVPFFINKVDNERTEVDEKELETTDSIDKLRSLRKS
jgi:hypothetical protein